MTHLYSVVVPTYNCMQYLGQAVRSVAKSPGVDWQVVIVDDGSTDQTDVVVKELEREFGSRVVYLRQKNSGVAAARNVGVAAAAGEYVAFLDADDVLLRGALAMRKEAFDANPGIDALFTDYYLERYCGYARAFNRHAKFASFLKQQGIVPSNNFYGLDARSAKWLRKFQCCVHTSAITVRKDVFEAEGGFNASLQVGEDHDLWYRLAASRRLGFLDVPTSLYCKWRGTQGKYERTIGARLAAVQLELQHAAIFSEDWRVCKRRSADLYADRAFNLLLPHFRLRDARRDLCAAVVSNPFRLRYYKILALACLPKWAFRALLNQTHSRVELVLEGC